MPKTHYEWEREYSDNISTIKIKTDLYYSESEVQELKTDIKQMLILISAFTEPFTDGEKLLREWQKKYMPELKGDD